MIALVSHTRVSGESGGPWTTPAITTTGGSLLVIGVSRVTTSGAITITDRVGGVLTGNVWVPLTEVGNTNSMGLRLYYCENPVVGANHTFSLAIGASDWAGVMGVLAFSGTATVSVFDKEAATNGGSSSTRQPGSVNPTNDDALVVSLFTAEASSSLSINSGFNNIETQNRQGSPFVFGPYGLAYLIQGAHAAVNPTWTLDAPDYNCAVIAVFNPVTDIPPTPAFTIAQTLKHVAVTSQAVAGTNPITSTLYDYDYPSSTTAATTHDYAEPGTYVIRQIVSDGTLSAHVDHTVITKSRYRYRGVSVKGARTGGSTLSNTVDRPDEDA